MIRKRKKSKGQAFVAKRMRDFAAGKMHSGVGGKKGARMKKSVSNVRQAIAISLSEAKKKGYKVGKKRA